MHNLCFICMRMENHFHIKGWALSTSFGTEAWARETQKWPIHLFGEIGFVLMKKYIYFFYLDTLNWLVWRGKRHSLFQYKTLSVGNNDESGYLRTREATSNWSGSDALFLLLLRAQASSFLITVTWLTLEFEGSTPSWKSGR